MGSFAREGKGEGRKVGAVECGVIGVLLLMKILLYLCMNTIKHTTMIITTTDFVPGKEITEILGIARGSTVRARNVGRDIFASLKNIVGGEIEEYTKLQAESREQAMQRMEQDAAKMGADAIINVRLATSMVVQGAAEILAYGTAVKIK